MNINKGVKDLLGVDENKTLLYHMFMFFVAATTGIVISYGVLTGVQILVLAAIAFVLFFVFNKPHIFPISPYRSCSYRFQWEPFFDSG